MKQKKKTAWRPNAFNRERLKNDQRLGSLAPVLKPKGSAHKKAGKFGHARTSLRIQPFLIVAPQSESTRREAGYARMSTAGSRIRYKQRIDVVEQLHRSHIYSKCLVVGVPESCTLAFPGWVDTWLSFVVTVAPISKKEKKIPQNLSNTKKKKSNIFSSTYSYCKYAQCDKYNITLLSSSPNWL